MFTNHTTILHLSLIDNIGPVLIDEESLNKKFLDIKMQTIKISILVILCSIQSFQLQANDSNQQYNDVYALAKILSKNINYYEEKPSLFRSIFSFFGWFQKKHDYFNIEIYATINEFKKDNQSSIRLSIPITLIEEKKIKIGNPLLSIGLSINPTTTPKYVITNNHEIDNEFALFVSHLIHQKININFPTITSMTFDRYSPINKNFIQENIKVCKNLKNNKEAIIMLPNKDHYFVKKIQDNFKH